MSYNYLLTVLGRAKADLQEAQRIANELARDKCLAAECKRDLSSALDYLAHVELVTRHRAESEDQITLARRAGR